MSVTRDQHGGEVDDDRFFLDQVLDKLYDFGQHKRLKKSQKRKNFTKDEKDTVQHDTDSEQPMTNSTVCGSLPSGAKQSNVEVVTFIDPRRKNQLSKAVELVKKAPPERKEVKEKKKVPDEKLTIEKARLEVHRFGLSGYERQQQRVFEQDRAIMLGARPPKRQYVNYKVYQQNIKERKIKEKEEAKSESQNKRRKEGQPRTERSKSSSSGELGGQVGRFKNGMLVLSSRDIQKYKVKVKKGTEDD
ncbi:uncharacterized protein C1orf131 homolog [Pimephales promelas]|uniref:uncharacterized protein C1orf131 homolog n=1 Tax=Pimephales promelas TaxID=90988 RepID=UPI0019559C60|nr:uncharacterized protein C1orf131 homolog [Pimephales promelas]KAG1964802.1 hypothetical protein F2P79_004486 [Pimephales promelas]